MKTLSQQSFSQLLNVGYTQIEFNVDAYVNEIIPDFLRLTEEPAEYREKWKVDLSGELNDPDDGLIERSKKEGKDEKFYFHYRPHLRKILEKRDLNLVRYNKFLEKCDELYILCAYAAEQVIKDLDKALPEYQLLKRLYQRDALTRHVVRMNRYKVGEVIKAKKHEDQSFLTLAPAASSPALFLDDETQCHQPEEGKTLIFFGEKAEYLDGKKFKAVPHWVQMEPNEWRWSIVVFTHIDVGISDKEVEAYFDNKRRLQAIG